MAKAKIQSPDGGPKFAPPPAYVNRAGSPSKSPIKSDGINKPMSDGLSKRQTQWTKS